MRNFRILHVEDDDNDALLVEHAFRKEAPQASLVVVTDGRAAQDYLSRNEALPDLVLMDLKLPRMTGLEVLEWMKAQPRLQDLPVFILSSSSEKQDVDRAQALGVAGYLSKQGSLKGLLDIVRDLVAFVDRR
jgi:CheY-like chemotaxis protein